MRVELSVPVSAEFDAEIARPLADRVPSRIADRDGTVFTDAAVAGDRLGWVDLPSRAEEPLTEIEEPRERLADAGPRSISLTGMGGSSLAPEVMATAAGVDLEIVDSTDPNQVAEAIGTDLDHTVLVIASKSGTTIETDAIRRAFAAAFEAVGIDPASRFIAITDPGTELDALATEQGYLATFHGDPSVGGRFSALSPFGLVPAGLAGVDVRQIVASAAAIASDLTLDSEDNPARASALGSASPTRERRRSSSSPTPPPRGLGAWVEQLVAESLGKDGQGILPVVVDGPGDIGFADARADAVLCTLGSDADFGAPSGFNAVVDGDLGEQFLFWEFATAIAGYSIGVDPFDQPDVEAAKAFARAALDQGAQNDEYHVFADGDVEVYGDVDEATDLVGALRELFDSVDEYGYIGVQAYLDRLGDAGAADLRPLVSRHAGVQTTFGFGPRYLHSTGQYHKGGHPERGVPPDHSRPADGAAGTGPRLRLRRTPARPGARGRRGAAGTRTSRPPAPPHGPGPWPRPGAAGDHSDRAAPPLRRRLSRTPPPETQTQRRQTTALTDHGEGRRRDAADQLEKRVMSPRRMIEAPQTIAISAVKRLRLRSATPEEPREDDMPPPNMSDMPPPLPLCMRMSRVRKMLVRTSTPMRTKVRISTSSSTCVSVRGFAVQSTGRRRPCTKRRSRARSGSLPDEGTVDVVGDEDVGDVVGLHGAAVEDPCRFGEAVAVGLARRARMAATISAASSAVAVFPVPIAHTGS